MSSEADIKGCPGITAVGHAFFFPLNMVFIKKACILREVWLSLEPGSSGAWKAAAKLTVIYADVEMCAIIRWLLGVKGHVTQPPGNVLLSTSIIQVQLQPPEGMTI